MMGRPFWVDGADPTVRDEGDVNEHRRMRERIRDLFDLGRADPLPLLVLFGLNLADEFDRIAFATLTPEIRDAFDLSDEQIVAVGSLSAMFMLMSAIPL